MSLWRVDMLSLSLVCQRLIPRFETYDQAAQVSNFATFTFIILCENEEKVFSVDRWCVFSFVILFEDLKPRGFDSIYEATFFIRLWLEFFYYLQGMRYTLQFCVRACVNWQEKNCNLIGIIVMKFIF